MGKIVTVSYTCGTLEKFGDTYLDDTFPTSNYGAENFMDVGMFATDTTRAIIKFSIPKPTATTGTIDDAILKNIKLGLNCYLADTPPIAIELRDCKKFLEGNNTSGSGADWNTYDGITAWNTVGGDYTEFIDSISVVGIGTYEFDFGDYFKYKDYDFNENIYVLLKKTAEAGANIFATFYSKEASASLRPYVVVEYEDPSPTKITDLKAIPNPDNLRQIKLTWSKNEDKDFVKYVIYGSYNSPVTMVSTNYITEITDQGQTSYLLPLSVSNYSNNWNRKIYWIIAVEDNNNKYVSDSDSTATPSNETSCLLPDINVYNTPTIDIWNTLNIIYSGGTGDITFSTALGTADITNVYYEWGDGGTAESSLTSRSHIYTKSSITGNFTVKMWVENLDGFRSSTSTGNLVTVNPISPIGIIKASPIVVEPCQTVYANGSESYARASNLSLAGYSFCVGSVGSESIEPIKEYKFSDTVGTTKTIYLWVSDSTGTYSDYVSYTITVSPASIYLLNLENPIETVGREKKRTHSIVNKLGTEGQDIIGTGSSSEILKLKGIIHANKNEDEWDLLWLLSRGDYLIDYRQPSYSDYNEVLRGYLTNFSDERIGGETGIKAYWNSDFIIKKRMVEKILYDCIFTADGGGSYYDIPSTEYPVADANSDGVVNANLCNGEYDAIIGTTQTLGAIEVDSNYEYRRIRTTLTTGAIENITYFYENV